MCEVLTAEYQQQESQESRVDRWEHGEAHRVLCCGCDLVIDAMNGC